MTIQGAMKELVNLLNADDIPIYYKGGIKKVIETIDDYIDGKDDYIKRKTEPQNGYQTFSGTSVYVSRFEDEPQTDNGIGCSRCEGRFDCYDRDMPHAVHCNNYGKVTDEPQTERYCTNCKHNGVIEDYECRTCNSMNHHEFIQSQTYCDNCMYLHCNYECAREIVHKMIDDAVIAEDVYPDLRQRMHDAVDEYEPQTERSE